MRAMLVQVSLWKRAASRTNSDACPGQSLDLARAMRADTPGHTLSLISWRGIATVVCVKCGAFTAQRCKILSKPCLGPEGMSVKRKGGLARLWQGRHPDDRNPGFFDAAWQLKDGELGVSYF